MMGAAGSSPAIVVPDDIINLDGHTVSAFKAGGTNADAHLKVDNDGNMYQQKNFGGYTQIDSTNDWVRPTTSSPGLYEVRFTSLVGDTLTSSTASEDTWWDVSSGDFILRLRLFGGGFDFASSVFDVEIRYDGGSNLASTSYTLSCSTEL